MKKLFLNLIKKLLRKNKEKVSFSPFNIIPHKDKSIMEELYIYNPYERFDPSGFAFELSGWHYESTIFHEFLEKTDPRLIIEVGTWKGGSAINMASYIKKRKLDTKIVCIDTWLGALEFWQNKEDRERYIPLKLKNGYPTVYYQFLFNVIHEGLQDIIIPFPQTSRIAARWLKWKGEKAELIYIDGSHDEEDVYDDVSDYYELLSTGGILFGDDYHSWPGVKRAVDRFARERRVRLKTKDYFWIIEK